MPSTGVATGSNEMGPQGGVPTTPNNWTRVQPDTPSEEVSQEPSVTMSTRGASRIKNSIRAKTPAPPERFRARISRTFSPRDTDRILSRVGFFQELLDPSRWRLTDTSASSSAAKTTSPPMAPGGTVKVLRKKRTSFSAPAGPQIHCGADSAWTNKTQNVIRSRNRMVMPQSKRFIPDNESPKPREKQECHSN